MEPTFRASMNWLHTWLGVVLGGLLFAIFWMGTLSVFDREIDRWMAPGTRLTLPAQPPALETLRPLYDAAVAAEASRWAIVLPTERAPVIHVLWSGRSSGSRLLDPATGAGLPDPGTWAGTRFLYPFHTMLHLRFGQLGIWLVGLASMAMLALCVSGVIVHRKIFADFFALRLGKAKSRRLILDLHNVTGVLVLPFHIAITLSGLIAFYWIYFPSGIRAVYGENPAVFYDTAYGSFDRPKLNRPAGLASMDAMVDEARRLWNGDAPHTLSIRHVGDAAAYVVIFRASEDRIRSEADAAYFDAATGQLLHQRTGPRPAMAAQQFIAGMHLIRFRHWTLRWLYFVLGLAGCVMIATGYLFWLDSRRSKHARSGRSDLRIVEGLTVGGTLGIVVATLAFLVANRVMPLGTTVLGIERAALEAWTFYLAWAGSFAYAWLRPARAWVAQCGAAVVLATAAVVLNWITTGDHVLRSLMHPHLWPVAGMDLMLLAGAALVAVAVRRLKRRALSADLAPARAAGLHHAE